MTVTAFSPLFYAESSHNSDLRYFGRILVGDPFIAFAAGKKKIGVFSSLEIDRAKKESTFTDVLSHNDWLAKAKSTFPKRKVGPAEVIALLGKHYGIKRFSVADDFPSRLFLHLNELGVKIEVVNGMIFPERER